MKHIFGPRSEETCLRVCVQQRRRPAAHPCSLISAFVIRHLEIKVASLVTCKISILYLDHVAEQTSLSLAFPETLKTYFVAHFVPVRFIRLYPFKLHG